MSSITGRHYIAILSTLLIFTSGRSAQSGEIRAKVLQVRDGEVGLNVGTEDLVFPGAKFVLMRGKDTVACGTIDARHRTMSVGVIDSLWIKADIQICSALVQKADIDSGATISFRTSLADPEPLINSSYQRMPQSLITKSFGDANAPIIFRPRDSSWAIGAIAVYAGDSSAGGGDADVSVSLMAPSTVSDDIIERIPAPFIVALIPNLSSKYCGRGELTKSLYQRFDPSRSQLYAPGMQIAAANSFLSPDSSHRAFPYDLDLARRRFRSLSPRPKEVVMLLREPVLQPLALYLADLLAREQCRVRIEANPAHWDFALCLLACRSNGRTGNEIIKGVIGELSRDTSTSGAADIVRDLAAKSVVPNYDYGQVSLSDVDEFGSQLSRLLMVDYGCFPLFRPTVVLRTKPTVRGLRFGLDQELDFRETFKIVFPHDSLGSTP